MLTDQQHPITPPPELIDRIERDGGTIEVMQDERGMVYHRVCAHGICRSCEDRWQAEMYLDQML